MATISEIITNNFQRCIFCDNSKSSQELTYKDGRAFNCPICGKYEVSGTLLCSDFPNDKLLNFFRKAPAIAAERFLRGQDGYLLKSFELDSFIMDYPKSFVSKMDRALMNLAIESKFEPKEITLRNEDFGKLFIEHDAFSNTEPDLKIMLDPLADEKFITYTEDAGIFFSVKLTIAGLKRVEELRNIRSTKHKAFIAMWFNDKTEKFRDNVKEAIEIAGYKAEIVDEIHHNDFIMDKVINLINESSFVIADLTSIPEQKDQSSSGIRGGVYYEAGYAKGLGIPVIFTCDKASHDRVHFDLQQMNTIQWEQTAGGSLKVRNFDFVEYLTEHIIATVGKGPVSSDS